MVLHHFTKLYDNSGIQCFSSKVEFLKGMISNNVSDPTTDERFIDSLSLNTIYYARGRVHL